MSVRLGVFIMPGGRVGDPDGLARFGKAVEDLGLATIWMGDMSSGSTVTTHPGPTALTVVSRPIPVGNTDLETIQREAQLRRIGRDLHDQAAAISAETVDAVAAVVTSLDSGTDYGDVVEEGFREARLSDSAVRHLNDL